MLATSLSIQAQDADDKKIKIRISKQVDGDTKTFEGEYANEEEMINDPAYREFSESDDETAWLDRQGEMERIPELHQGPSGFSFDFDEDFFSNLISKSFDFSKSGTHSFFFDDQDAVTDLRGWNGEEFEEKLSEKMEQLEDNLKDLDTETRESIRQSIEDIQELHTSMGTPKRITRSTLSISEVGDDFGEKGKVSENEKLELNEVNLTSARNRLIMKLKPKGEGELSVKISTQSGKDIYNRYFETFGGTFSDTIDFSPYSDGKYLLEIQRGKKRLTKKIVIEIE